MKKILASVFMLCFGVTGAVNAQYYSLLNPQTQQQIAKFKEQKVAVQTAFIDMNGNQAPYGISKYNAEGKIIANINPKNHQHFVYDESGKLVSFIDSANDGRRFF